MLLIGALASDPDRSTQVDVYAAVLIGLSSGLEAGRRDCSRLPEHASADTLCFERVDSYDDLIKRARMKQQISARGYLDAASMRSVLQAGFFKDKLSGYVGIQIIKLETGFALEALVFKEAKDAAHPEVLPIRRKYLIAESGAGELVQLATELGQRIAAGTDSPPVAHLRHPLSRDVRVGTEVTLDASPSQDYDFDRLYWRWSQIDGPPVLPPQGSVRSVWRFTAESAGVYRFKVKVNDCAAPEADAIAKKACPEERAAEQTVTITAGNPPTPRRFPPELVPVAPKLITLDKSCEPAKGCTWTQIEGPQVAAPAKGPADARELGAPGLYRFAWRDENNFGAETSIKTYLVAPPPVAVPDVPSLVFMGNSGVLDGTGSFDPLGEPLTYLWTVKKTAAGAESQELERACGLPSEPPPTNYYVTTPSSPESTLRISEEGFYAVALTVTARRKLEDQTVIQSVCVAKAVQVIQRRFELWPLGGFVKWEKQGQRAFGMYVGASLAIDASLRTHVEQLLYRHIDSGGERPKLEPLGGTRLFLSYSLGRDWLWDWLRIRPLLGLTVRAFGEGGDAWGPRFGISVPIKVGRFLIAPTFAVDELYSFRDKEWRTSPDLAVAFGVTL